MIVRSKNRLFRGQFKNWAMLCFLMWQSWAVQAQNLVPNHSFENYSQCPGHNDYTGFVDNWTEPGTGSTDYYNPCFVGSVNLGSPSNYLGYQQAYSGVSYSGIGLRSHGPWSPADYREYIQVQLLSPLVAGETYDFSMMVSRADGTEYYSSSIGVYFSNNAVTANNYFVLPFIPQIVNPANNYMIDTAIWQPITGSYLAVGGEEYITIGNFENDQNTISIFESAPPFHKNSYVYIDEVILTPACSNPVIDAGPDQTVCPGTSVTLSGTGADTYVWDNGVTDGVPFTPTTTATYTLIGADATGCQSTDQVTITVSNGLLVDLGTDTTNCTGGSIVLDAQNSGATYLWNDGSVGQTLTVTQSGTYYVDVNDNGCTGTDTVEVLIGSPPSVNAGIDQSVCSGSQITLTGSGAPTLEWDNGITDGTPFTPGTTTQYVLTGTSIEGCVNTDTVLVTVLPLPMPTIIGDLDYCQGESVSLDAGAGYSDYSWSTGATIQNASGLTTVNNPITVTVTDANGCEGTSPPVNLVEHALPVVDLDGEVFFCEGDSILLDAGNGGSDYLWNTAESIQTIYVSTIGSYHVQVTSAMGCVNSDTVEVTQEPLPLVDAGENQTVCAGTAVTLEGSGANQLVWDNGISDGTPFTPVATTEYTLTGTSTAGCVNTDTVLVTVLPLPTPTIMGDIDYCVGETVSLNTDAGYSTYSWSTGASTQNADNLTAANNPITVAVTDADGCSGFSQPVNLVEHPLPVVDLGGQTYYCQGDSVLLDAGSDGSDYLWSTTATSQTIYASTVGSYHVQVTSTMGCVNSDTVEVTEKPLPDVDAGSDQTICLGEEVVLVGAGTGTFNWSDGVVDSAPFAPIQTGVYTLTITDINNCTNTDDVLVEVMDLPDASFAYSPQEIELSDSEVTFTNTTINGSTYHWTFGEGGSSNEEHPVYLYEAPGTYTVTLVATSDFGCVDTAYATLEVIDVPYCYVPNSFSPNGDGVNDLFIPVLSGRLPSKYELLIFNRWGEVIYETDDYTQTWDGKYQSVDCPIDSYVWLVRMVDKDGVSVTELTGHLNLIR